jgi:hypothetical protein
VPEPCNAAAAADIQFDASSSRDSSGRPIKRYRWDQAQANDLVLADAISKANAANAVRCVQQAPGVCSTSRLVLLCCVSFR